MSRARRSLCMLPLLLALAVDVACSSSSSSSTQVSQTNCCEINGQAFDCPSSAAEQKCVDGDTTACTARSTSCNGGTSNGTTDADSGSGSMGTMGTMGSGGCSLFKCASSSDCGGVAPCMSTSTGTNYCYEQEGSPDLCSSGTTATTAQVSGMSRTLCVPSGCPQPVMFLQ